jgi:hypothetical protein
MKMKKPYLPPPPGPGPREVKNDDPLARLVFSLIPLALIGLLGYAALKAFF